MVEVLEDNVDSGNPDATAHKLEQLYASQKDADSWKPGGTVDIAWESNQVARTQIYEALRIPVEPCEPEVKSCVHAPQGRLDLDGAYMNKTATVAGEQLRIPGTLDRRNCRPGWCGSLNDYDDRAAD